MRRRTFLRAVGQLSALAGVAALIPGSVRDAERGRWHERMELMMGGFTSIAIRSSDDARAEQQLSACFDYMRQCVAEISCWNEQSTTSRLNIQRELGADECSASFRGLITAMERLAPHVNQAFSPFTGQLTALWRATRERGELPTVGEVRERMRECLATRLVRTSSRYALSGDGNLEFGGIGKGFIADLGARFLVAQGVSLARIDCGGDIRFLGDIPWQIDIEHPRADGLLGVTTVSGSVGIATSGDYRSYVEINGRRFHHLLNMQDGFPATFAQSTTVIAPNAVTADALASAFYVIPVNDALVRSRHIPGVEVLIVDAQGDIHRTPGFSFVMHRDIEAI